MVQLWMERESSHAWPDFINPLVLPRPCDSGQCCWPAVNGHSQRRDTFYDKLYDK